MGCALRLQSKSDTHRLSPTNRQPSGLEGTGAPEEVGACAVDYGPLSMVQKVILCHY